VGVDRTSIAECAALIGLNVALLALAGAEIWLATVWL
jgi:hypothetical protein